MGQIRIKLNPGRCLSLVDITNIKYEVRIIDPSGKQMDVTPFVSQLSFGDADGELAAHLSMTLTNQQVGGKWIHQLVALGTPIYLLANGVEVFRGTVFDWMTSTDPLGSVDIEAYDQLIYLFKSEDDRYYRSGQRAIDVLTDIFRAWNIPIGKIEGPNVVLAKQVFRQMTVAEMINSILKQGKDKGAGEFIVRSEKGKVYIRKAMSNQDVYVFAYNENVQSVMDRWSINNLVTRVRIIGAEDEEGRAPLIAVLDGDTKYGILQRIVQNSSDDTIADAKQNAKEILKEFGQPEKDRTIRCVDVPFIRKGDKVKVVAGTLNGYYQVVSVEHNVTSLTMSVGLK